MRVLQISMGEEFGGVEKLELDIFNNVSKSIKMDLLTPVKVFDNSNSYDFNTSRKSIFGRIKFAKELKSFLSKNKYDVVHINSSVFLFSYHISLICKKCGVKKVIAHAHSVPHMNFIRRIIRRLLTKKYLKLVNNVLGCSKDALGSLLIDKYINKGIVVHNGINVDKYRYNEKLRDKYRKLYKLEEKIVYSHVGRFEKEKNHSFLIDIFKSISDRQDNAYLILVGDGSLKEDIEEKVKELKLEDKVLFLGFREDISDLLNCMDIFIFPSFAEGLGISLIEAQTNGLFVYASDKTPEEVRISKYFKYFSLNEDIDKISNRIINNKIKINRSIMYKNTINNNYDIKYTCRMLEDIYKK